MKKNLTIEEREYRKRKSFLERGIDYDEYCRKANERKVLKKIEKENNIERNRYHKNHEDDIQFGCCSPDTLSFSEGI